MPVSAMMRPMSCPGHSWVPALNDRCARLWCTGVEGSGRIAWSTFPAARPSRSMSPALIRCPPRVVSSLAQRPGHTIRGGSSQRTCSTASGSVICPPASDPRNRGSVTTMRRTLAIRLAVVS